MVAIYVLALAAIQEAFALPLVFYRGFILERRYELSEPQPLHAWLRDHAKAFALLAAVLLVGAPKSCTTPDRAGIAAGGGCLRDCFAAAAAAVLVRLAPVLLLPMFYRFTPSCA